MIPLIVNDPPADTTTFTRGVPPDGPKPNPAARADALGGVFHGMTLPREEDVTPGAPGCQRCEVLPRPLRGPGTVRLRFAHTASLGQALAHFAATSWEHAERGGALCVRVPYGGVEQLLEPLLDRMSSTERRDARASFEFDGQFGGFHEVQTLPRFAARARCAGLLDALRARRLAAAFQPVVRCDGGGVVGHECLLRAEVDGAPASPRELYRLAADAGLLFQLDLAARRAALAAAASHRPEGVLFVNFTPHAIYAPESCLHSTVAMVDDLGLDRTRVAFEFALGGKAPELKHLRRIAAYLRGEGFAVSLDDVGGFPGSLDALRALAPDYAKLDAGLTRAASRDAEKGGAAARLLDAAQDGGGRGVGKGVETADELAWLRRRGAELVQGFLFARPAFPPPQLAGATP